MAAGEGRRRPRAAVRPRAQAATWDSEEGGVGWQQRPAPSRADGDARGASRSAAGRVGPLSCCEHAGGCCAGGCLHIHLRTDEPAGCGDDDGAVVLIVQDLSGDFPRPADPGVAAAAAALGLHARIVLATRERRGRQGSADRLDWGGRPGGRRRAAGATSGGNSAAEEEGRRVDAARAIAAAGGASRRSARCVVGHAHLVPRARGCAVLRRQRRRRASGSVGGCSSPSDLRCASPAEGKNDVVLTIACRGGGGVPPARCRRRRGDARRPACTRRFSVG